jgi:hypothetical protein
LEVIYWRGSYFGEDWSFCRVIRSEGFRIEIQNADLMCVKTKRSRNVNTGIVHLSGWWKFGLEGMTGNVSKAELTIDISMWREAQ